MDNKFIRFRPLRLMESWIFKNTDILNNYFRKGLFLRPPFPGQAMEGDMLQKHAEITIRNFLPAFSKQPCKKNVINDKSNVIR